MRASVLLTAIGLALIVAGFVSLALSTAAPPSAGASYGGLILIGPVPIIFGAGPQGFRMAEVAALLGIALLAVAVVTLLAVAPHWESGDGGDGE
jgi:uncharacterized membrane protein